MTATSPIGVFDSGIGGLTVLRELLSALPSESYVYFGDSARVPYGNKSPETVLRFSRENVHLLLDRGVKMVVIACNTASAEALPRISGEFPVPIVGVIDPGVRAALAATTTGRVGVIGTEGTIRSGAYQSGIRSLRPDADVTARACPMFVPLAEEGWTDGPIARAIAEEYLSVYDGTGIDALVLGCTHYPLLKDVIGQVMGAGVRLVDSAVETALEVSRVLADRNLKNNTSNAGDFRVILSDTSAAFHRTSERFLGRPVPDIELVSV